METANEQVHALLIGIDAYAFPNELHGCVNDIDRIEKLLTGTKVNLDRSRIRRIASPHGPSTETPATRDNIRKELVELAGRVGPGDRVFIYYSGHGLRRAIPTEQGSVHREALVPVDGDQGKVLFD